jgi:hypothetical protein
MSIVLNKKNLLNTSNTPSTTSNTPSTTSNTPSTTSNTPSSTINTTQPTKTNTTQSSTQPSTSIQPTTTSITKNELKPVNNSSRTIKIKNETKNISPEKLEEINKDYLTRLSNNPLQGIPNDKSKIKLPPKLQAPKLQASKLQASKLQKPVESKLVQNPLLKNNKIDMKVVGIGAPKLPRRSIVKPKYTIKDLEDKDLKKKTIEILRNNVKKNEKNIFGKEEIKFQKEIVNCTKLYLIEKKVLSKNGTIKNKDLVNKTKLWEYIMYIRSKNKNLTIFKDTLGKGNSVELYKLYLLLVKNVKERDLKDYKSSKDNLIKLIKIIIKQNPTLSFLKNYNPKTQSRKSSSSTKTKTINNKPGISNIDITLKTNSGLERTTPQKANIKVDITKL